MYRNLFFRHEDFCKKCEKCILLIFLVFCIFCNFYSLILKECFDLISICQQQFQAIMQSTAKKMREIDHAAQNQPQHCRFCIFIYHQNRNSCFKQNEAIRGLFAIRRAQKTRRDARLGIIISKSLFQFYFLSAASNIYHLENHFQSMISDLNITPHIAHETPLVSTLHNSEDHIQNLSSITPRINFTLRFNHFPLSPVTWSALQVENGEILKIPVMEARLLGMFLQQSTRLRSRGSARQTNLSKYLAQFLQRSLLR